MSSRRHSVLVVDDSPFVRAVVCDTLARTPDFVVAGEAANGLEAIRRVHELAPDLVTLDLEMPAMGGLDALGYIMSECPRPVVVLSGHAPLAQGDLTIRALELGAVDFVRKPSWAHALDVETLQRRLVQALREARGGRLSTLTPCVAPPRNWRHTPGPGRPTGGSGDHPPANEVVVVAASTGGPKALSELIPHIAPEVSAAIVIVQHMPAGFTTSLARRLHEMGPRPVQEVMPEMPLSGGRVYVAPGGWHVRFASAEDGAVRMHLSDDAAVLGVRPAADVTLMSAAVTFEGRCVAVVLTGMGRDGASGCLAVRAQGGRVIVQDPASCVVSGMSQAVIAAGAASEVRPLRDLATAIARMCAASRP